MFNQNVFKYIIAYYLSKGLPIHVWQNDLSLSKDIWIYLISHIYKIVLTVYFFRHITINVFNKYFLLIVILIPYIKTSSKIFNLLVYYSD